MRYSKRMKVDLNKLNQKLKNNERTNLYLVYGEEKYLVEQCKRNISSCIIKEGDEFNLSKFSGNDFDTDAVIAMADTLPFFSDYRLLLIEDSGLFKKSNDDFFNYIKEAPEHTVFLFVESEVDKRSKLFKYLSDNGDVIEINEQKEQVLRLWIGQLAKKEGFSISTDTANLILEKTGTDMFTISNELAKLCAYCTGKLSIEKDDVNAVCADRTPPQIFEMIRAMSEKNAKETLDYYYELLENKEPPLRILSLIARQFRLLYKVSLCRDRGENSYIIASQIGLSSYIVDKLIRQANNFSTKELAAALNDCGETEYKIKSGLLTDKIGVELLLVHRFVKYST